ncbi:MAG: ROK family protein [Cytophagales bacterium]|nr:ROK family protein [Cytophagales bacterium]
MQIFTGIDIGGSNIKIGLVDSSGQLLEKKKVPTRTIREAGKHAADKLVEVINEWLDAHPKVKHVGIGVPGMLSRNQRVLLELANIPELNGVMLLERLERYHEKVTFHMENDANAAALGELYFGKSQLPDSFMLITLGTGVGGGVVINRKIFKGGDGNAMEIGHIVAGNGRTIEQTIGKAGIIQMTKELMAMGKKSTYLHPEEPFDDDDLINAAQKGDTLVLTVFEQVGKYVGQAIVSSALILDIKTVLIGGGLAKGFPYMQIGWQQTFRQFLSPYYASKMRVLPATLGNNAGILGAAALCFRHES